MTLARCTLLIGLLLAWPTDLRADPSTEAVDEHTLQAAGHKTDGPGLLEFFRRQTLSQAEQERLGALVRQLGDSSFPVREKASAELRVAGRLSLALLREALRDPDLEVARRARYCLQAIESSSPASQALAAARLLAVRRPEGATEAVLSFLPFADDEAVEEELLTTLGAVGVRDGKAHRAVIAALQDGQPARRAAAALVIGRLTESERHPRVRLLLADTDPRVRLRAAQGLLAGRDKAAVPTLVALLSDGPLPLANTAEDLLCRLAGDQSPPITLGAGQEEERRKCRDAWHTWWQTRGAELDLPRLDVESRLLGLTLICVCDGYNQGKGRVWEVGPDGKTRWEINDVQYPVDAQVLPGNRVLIAEQSGRRVTERDQRGTVLWEYKVNENLVGCQRLPNGHTFIATNTRLYEVDRSGKVLVTYPGHQGTVYSAVKLRNGNVAYMSSNYKLVELDRTGKEVRSFKVEFQGLGLSKIEPLPGGRFLIGEVKQVSEFDETGKVVQAYPVPSITAAMRLPNGNVIVGGIGSREVREVDRQGKVVWKQSLEGSALRVRRR